MSNTPIRQLTAPMETPCATRPEIFFGEADGLKGQQRRMANYNAKQLCAHCPLMKPCLSYALKTNQVFGVWGGKTEKEREQLQKVRKLVFPGGRK